MSALNGFLENNDGYIGFGAFPLKKLYIAFSISKFWLGDWFWYYESEISKHNSLIRIDVVKMSAAYILNVVFLIFDLKIGVFHKSKKFQTQYEKQKEEG